jgi:rhamnulokinase
VTGASVARRERIVAVDLGASSGRLYTADVGAEHFVLNETGRFVNGSVQLGENLFWDVLGLYRGILDGLTSALREGPVSSVGVDSWAVDYGLVRPDGSLLSNPACYRDPRTEPSIARAKELVGFASLFERTGIAHQPFNTVFQLMTDVASGHLGEAKLALLLPDLINYFLTGEAATEFTNASTTQLLTTSGEWDQELFSLLGLESTVFAPLVNPANVLAPVTPTLAQGLGTNQPIGVINVASHDTASAVVAVPASNANFAYISCGTWSLVGVELESPVVSQEARHAGFSNERGVEGTYRFLHNVMGLWTLQESIRTWELRAGPIDVAALVARSEREEPLRSLIDINDGSLLAPGDMPARIATLCRASGEPVPETPEQFTRCILDSLALAYRRAVDQAQVLAGMHVDVVHMVGGGVNNAVLCQLTADACGLEVVAGPVEAAAIGNVLVQAGALGVLDAERWALRRFLQRIGHVRVYQPNPSMTKRFSQRGV